MGWVLCLGHAVLGVLLLPFAAAGDATRRRAVEAASLAGVLLGVALVVAGATGAEGWRSVAFEPGSAAPAGAAAAAAWVLVAALAERARVADAALIGAAATGLAVAAGGRYVVPSLIFWLCSSAALAALGVRRDRAAARAWAVLALSDAAVCAAAVLHVWRAGTWTARGTDTAVAWALALAAVVRGGAHLGAPWPGIGTRSAAAAPLLAGGAVVLAGRAGETDPWLALLVLGSAGAALARGLSAGRVTPALLATWSTALAIAVCFVTPPHAGLAGAAAVLAVAAAALWPFSGTRAGFERGLLVAAVPLTVGFGAVSAGAAASFERAVGSGPASLPWTAVAALLPAALAGGVVLAARAARAAARELVPEAVLATWLLLAAAVVAGLAPGILGGPGTGLGSAGGVAALYLLAAGGGAAAVAASRRWEVGVEPPPPAGTLLSPATDPALPPPLAWTAGAVAAVTAAATAWLTVAGLRVGFL
jgi:hypothetical protein